MRPFVAAAAGIALVFGLAFAFRSGGGKATQADVESGLVCITCHAPLDASNSPLAQQMKAEIRKQLAAGRTKKEIEQYFIDRLGPLVIGVPRKHGFDLFAWLIPLGGIALGAGAVGAGARAWSRNRSDDPDAPDGTADSDAEPALDSALEARVDQELARYDE